MIVPLSIRVAADTPPLFFSLLASLGKNPAFAYFSEARPVVLNFYEATSTFTLVTTRIVARLHYCRLCRWASEGNVSISPCHPRYMALAFTMTGLSPVRVHCPLLGTPIIKVRPQELFFKIKGCRVMSA